MSKITPARCPHCNKEVLAVAVDEVNHILHLLVCLFSCGAWVIVWLLLSCGGTLYVCPDCKHCVKREGGVLPMIVAVPVLIFYAIVAYTLLKVFSVL